jgi:hypothetical protein
MKKLLKALMLMALVVGVSSCGKENKSGGGDSPAATPAPTPVVATSTASNYTNYERIKNYYAAKSLAENTTVDMPIYHVGPYFRSNSNTTASIDFGICFQFLGYQSGDCDNNNYNTNQLYTMINNGRYLELDSVTAEEITGQKAYEVDGDDFKYKNFKYNKTSNFYTDMIGDNMLSYNSVAVSAASILLSDGRTIWADYIEYYSQDGSFVKGYVVASELPLIANPVGVTESYQGRKVEFIGALKFAGKFRVISMRVEPHRYDRDSNTNAESFFPLPLVEFHVP